MSVSLVHSKPTALRAPRYNPPIPGDFLNAVQAALKAKAVGLKYRHQYAKLAEAVLVQALPEFADEIKTVGARKGKSAKIGAQVASRLGGPAAAALVVLWFIRNARRPGIEAVVHTAAHKAGFTATVVRLVGQVEAKRLIGAIRWREALQR